MTDLPNTFIAGAAKCGTTSLCHYLAQHPDVFLPEIKEPHYFSFGILGNPFKGPGDERFMPDVPSSLEEYKDRYRSAGNQILIDGSTSYFSCESSATAIKQHCPEAKIIFCFRNPSRRAFSAYSHLRKDQRESEMDFAKALELEPDRIAQNYIYMWRYREISRYYDKVQRFFDIFDKNRIYVCLFERFLSNPKEELANLCRFLEIDDQFPFQTGTRHNKSSVLKKNTFTKLVWSENPVLKLLKKAIPKNMKKRLINRQTYKLELDPEIFKRLNEEFAPSLNKLEEVIGQNVDILRN